MKGLMGYPSALLRSVNEVFKMDQCITTYKIILSPDIKYKSIHITKVEVSVC